MLSSLRFGYVSVNRLTQPTFGTKNWIVGSSSTWFSRLTMRCELKSTSKKCARSRYFSAVFAKIGPTCLHVRHHGA